MNHNEASGENNFEDEYQLENQSTIDHQLVREEHDTAIGAGNSNEEEINELAASAKELAVGAKKKGSFEEHDLPKILEKKDKGDEPWTGGTPVTLNTHEVHRKHRPGWWPNFKKIASMLGIAGAIAGNASATTNAEDTTRKQSKVSQRLVRPVSDIRTTTANTPRKLRVYDKSNTPEGAITPTGLTNSFYENEYGITEEKLADIARVYDFPTESEGAFQKALNGYVYEHHPEILDAAYEKFGHTNQGEMIHAGISREEILKSFNDGKLGRRTAFIANELYKKYEPPKPKTELPPVSTEETPKTPEQPTGKYVINVRGDEHDGSGTYFFLDDKDEFMELTDKIGHYSHRETSGDGSGQATIDMPWETWKKDRNAKAYEARLGTKWQRDPSNPKLFIPVKTTAHFYDGFKE